MKRTPCYGCGRRHATCHIDCPEYKEFRERKKQEYKERLVRFEVSDALLRPTYNRIDAWKRRRIRK